MTSPPNITFGYLQMEERYKNLERSIKKMQLNQRINETGTNQVLDSRSCASSVNGNMLDCETSSRVGSEVVSSSTNMRNILSQRLNTPTHGITTSSVKNSPEVIDRAIMPPPKTIGILAHSSRRNSLASPQIVPKTTTSGIESNTSVISAINYPSASEFDKQKSNILHSTLDTSKPDRIFQRWKVALSNTGELLIKGFIEGNKYVRSKPVVERINSTTVKSFFSHIYSLEGRIHDEAKELPEYVRGKFYNGFPDDWKNVHHVWQSFVAGGCSDNFRWPTPITDSDDDLISEITEVNNSKSLKRSRARKRLLRNHESTGDFLKKSLIESSVKQKLSSPRHPSVKSAAQISGDPQSSIFQTPTESLQKDLNKSPRSRSRVNQEVAADSDNESRQAVDKVLGTILLNSANVQPSDEQLETLKAFSILLKNKKYSVEFLENIVEMSNSLMSVISRTSDEHPAESNQFSMIESNISSKNHSATYTKAGINKNLSAKSNKMLREQVVDQVSSKHSAKNNSKYVPVRRKLTNRHYDTSDEFDSHDDDEPYDSRYALKSRLVRIPSKRLPERPGRVNHARRRRSLDSESSDLDEFAHKNKKSLVSPAYDDRRKNTNVVEPEQKKFLRNEIRKPIQSQHTVRNSRIPLPRSVYLHDRGGAESASTITGFLANYDSCASITEDERALRTMGRQNIHLEQNKKMTVPVGPKYPLCYDSCISITEDESSRLKKVIKENNYKKPILQEKNAQYLDQVMKRTSIQRLNQLAGHGKPQQRPATHSETTEEFPQAVSSKATMTDDKENEKIANNQALHPVSPKIIQIEERQDTVKKITPEKIKPTIVRIENVAMKLNSRQMESLSRKVKSPKKIIDNQLTEDKLIKKSRSTEDKPKVLKSPEILEPNVPDKSKSTEKYPRDTRNDKLLEMQSQIVFGSEKNPKVLTCWMPNIKKLSEKKYGLVFEGKLLNEAGHVSTKKYVTDMIIRRVTPKLVETVNNEFYELSGDIVNNKHLVPQELQKLCLDGCPAKITAFCEKWANIKYDNSNAATQSLNGSVDIASAPTSSRGRRIVQSLRYWEGERLSMKGDEVYYSPGHFQESITSSNEASKKDTLHSSPRKQQSTSKNELTVVKKNQSHLEKEKKSKPPVEQDDLVNAKKLKDNNNYNLNNKKSSAKKTASPRVSESRRRSQRFRSLKRKSYREVKSSSDSSDSDDGKLQSKRRRNVNRNELRPEDNDRKIGSKNKSKHDRGSSDSDKTPQGTSYQYRKVAYRDKFFSDE
ncbi:GSCOCG00003475001-RA-CDS [Cotesia congregata]|uniref:SANTA domain-containing protein n=1 Tax=Cotesia congregata TaxID=51543 RepID=A0A8J2HPW3_COTCN|nr:GSCOCG00003475001-RA-CDS [Cotesia congregata]CAG5108690.1 Protein of unknown function [Cotesia congregata]